MVAPDLTWSSLASSGAALRVAGTRWITHQIAGVGVAAVSATALAVPAATTATLLAAAWIGSLLPDADRAGSRVYRRTRVERRVPLARLAGWLLRLPLRPLVLLRHRGITHSLVACAAVALATWALVGLADADLGVAAGAGMAIGYGAHVLADACTPAGVPLWAPLSSKPTWMLPAWARIKTGSAREFVVATALTGALVSATFLL
ncbi:metal-dependent hydrolase [Solirubrobacter ginsenosidimutans]|uniref:metal-dependent hydrolase n=1 Tax=Solirubrobacter ginsenosidimutans TaxID=490573 RepID=UPI0027E2DF7C|nr:metal-dependent hydrolase [Solirubrobacter ginsenosidimutans]